MDVTFFLQCFVTLGPLAGCLNSHGRSRRQITPCSFMCTGPATSCSNTVRRHLASCVLDNFLKIFDSATEFCRRNKSQKIKSDWICATCCGDKILLQRQRFSQKFSSTHEGISRCNVLPRHVAATCHLVSGGGVLPYITYAGMCRPKGSWFFEAPDLERGIHFRGVF